MKICNICNKISAMDKDIDLVHYDSDKSYYGRKWSQEIIWKNRFSN